jgi:Protein of unknown function (DUF2786)
MQHLDNTIKKIQDLLARADHPNTPLPEAETARSMAQRLMDQYRIEETHLAESGQLISSLSPQWKVFTVCRNASEFAHHYRAMASYIFSHLGMRAVFKYMADEEDMGTNVVAEMVGFESDLRFAEVMYTQVQLGFQAKLEPKFDPTRTKEENAYIMRSAGMEGWRIAQAIFGKDDRSLRPKVRKMFRDEAVRRGEDPTILLGQGNSVKTFRTSYADGFVSELHHILFRMRMAEVEDNAGKLVLASREEMINEAFYERYPQYRPVKTAHKSAAWTDPREGCVKCKEAKSGYCREHGWLKPKAMKPVPTNYTAMRRGSAAAREVGLDANTNRKGGKLDGSGPAAKELT